MKNSRLLLVTAMITLLIAGCAKATPTPAGSPPAEQGAVKDAIEITVITSYGGDDGNRQNYEKALREYEAASGNIINDASGISSEEWKSSIMAGFAAGTEPDVLFYFTGVDSNKIIEDGKVVSVDEIRSLYPDYASNMKDDMLAKSPVDGKSYAIPVNGYWEGLFANKKVLADCGVEIPDANTTWEQFLADCRIIADKGYVPIAVSLNEVPHYWFEFCILNNGTIESHLQIPESSSDEVGRGWADGLYDIKDLYEKGFFPSDTLTAANTETDALIINDKAAFMIDGSWKIGWFAENSADINNFTVTYVPGKGMRKPTDIIGGLSMGYFITKKAWDNSEKQAACVEFVTAMTTDEVVADFGATAVTALKNGIPAPSEANGLVKDALKMTKDVTGVFAATADGFLPNARSNLFANISNIVTGAMLAEEAIDQFISEN